MGLRDILIDSCYETQENSHKLVDEFYIPVLGQAVQYYRIAGFFSSSALAVAAKGIEELIHNNGKMYLLISPMLSEEDYRVITEHQEITADADVFSAFKLEQTPDENLQALAWLLDCGRLEIKIVISKRSRASLFHQKIGIITDATGDSISFSGSINETANAWLMNIEEFKVFKSWEPGQNVYLKADHDKFLTFWNNKKPEVADVYDIPETIRKRLISIKPRNIEDLAIMRKYTKDRRIRENTLDLFPHQERAVESWLKNSHSLLMEMATGTGKTRTAIGCLAEQLKSNRHLLCIVSTPQNTLSRQWMKDVEELNIPLDYKSIIDGTVSYWNKKLRRLLIDLASTPRQNSNAIIFTTHNTSSSEKFIDIIKAYKGRTEILFICDEVHAIGSEKQRKALLDEYEYRIGLSATPERMFDEEGTSLIRNYFGDKSFEFTIADALHTINPKTGKPFLNPFKYYPIFVQLNNEEQTKYGKKSSNIYIEMQKDYPDWEKIERYRMERAQITKNAEGKIFALEKLLKSTEMRNIQDTIIFVTDKQIDGCLIMLSNMGIKRAKVTERESTSERQNIISLFANHQLQVLLGMKCLDEGIDIKNARIAIIMASSTNPREYVQRVGRVIRPAPGKEESIIYDFIVTPKNGDMLDSEIIKKEARRAYHIAQNATNLEEIKRLFKEKGGELDADQ